jgi:membrane protein
MKTPRAFKVPVDAVNGFLDDHVMTLAAALAYYTTLALAPLLLILLAVAGILGSNVHQAVVHEAESLAGQKAGAAIGAVMRSVEGQNRRASVLSFVIGIAALLVSATGVVGQLQYSLNTVWGVESKPGKVVQNWFRKRLISLAMILGIGFVLLASLVVTAAISILVPRLESNWRAVEFSVSVAVYTVLFAGMFKFLPDVKVGWSDVWIGAAITAALFAVGKYGIGKYLGYSSIGSSYGAAGSIVIILVWMYYASLILLFGAEVTRAFARVHGNKVIPEKHAKWALGS